MVAALRRLKNKARKIGKERRNEPAYCKIVSSWYSRFPQYTYRDRRGAEHLCVSFDDGHRFTEIAVFP